MPVPTMIGSRPRRTSAAPISRGTDLMQDGTNARVGFLKWFPLRNAFDACQHTGARGTCLDAPGVCRWGSGFTGPFAVPAAGAGHCQHPRPPDRIWTPTRSSGNVQSIFAGDLTRLGSASLTTALNSTLGSVSINDATSRAISVSA